MSDQDQGGSGMFRQLAAYGHLGMMFPVSIGLGLLAGYGLDRWLGTRPWLALVGFGFGTAAAIVNLFRTLAAEERRLQEAHDSRVQRRRERRR